MKANLFTDEMFFLSPDKDIDEETEKLFFYYKEHGYPNYKKEDYSLDKEYYKLLNFDTSKIEDEKNIKQNMIGCGILWTYFPHWITIPCNSNKSLEEEWSNDKRLKQLIRKVYKWKIKHKELHWTNNRIRQCAKVFLSHQSVSNFRPSVAKYIYNKYGNSGKVLDMSSGFGGRLFGFSASDCQEYVGLEPSTKTYAGLLELSSDLKQYIPDKNIKIIQSGSEIYLPEYENYFDLCFTSPPYFNTEKYAYEETQSWVKFKTKDEWLNGFLKQTLMNCYRYTKKYCIINIANCINLPDLEYQTKRIANECGFILEDTLFLTLSSISKIKSRKYEPIFVFIKKENDNGI